MASDYLAKITDVGGCRGEPLEYVCHHVTVLGVDAADGGEHDRQRLRPMRSEVAECVIPAGLEDGEQVLDEPAAMLVIELRHPPVDRARQVPASSLDRPPACTNSPRSTCQFNAKCCMMLAPSLETIV